MYFISSQIVPTLQSLALTFRTIWHNIIDLDAQYLITMVHHRLIDGYQLPVQRCDAIQSQCRFWAGDA